MQHNAKQRGEEVNPAEIAASFQESVIDVLVTKTIRAAKEYEAKQILVAGGVAANRGLRNRLNEKIAELRGVELVIPPLKYCTDNAAMIAAAGSVFYEKGIRADLSLNANPGLDLMLF